MKRGLLVVIMFLLTMMAIAIPNVKANPEILWGVTGAYEVFKVDTATGVVTIVNTNPQGPLYGDIAMSPNGHLYVTGAAQNDFTDPLTGALQFDDLYELDPMTGNIIASYINFFTNAGFLRCNALAAESSTSLLAIEGGGVCVGWGYPTGPRLLRITLDGSGIPLGVTNLGALNAAGAASMCSDGDLDRDPVSGKWYAGFWANAGSEMIELNLANPGASVLVSQSNIQYEGGFAFDSAGIAYAGSWADENLYNVNVLGGGSSILYDLSSDLGGAIYGLSYQFEFAPPVGGEWVPVNIVQLLTPWIALGLIALGIAIAGIKRFAFRRP